MTLGIPIPKLHIHRIFQNNDSKMANIKKLMYRMVVAILFILPFFFSCRYHPFSKTTDPSDFKVMSPDPDQKYVRAGHYLQYYIVSDDIAKELSDDDFFLIREIDSVFIKGKKRPVVLFEIYNHEDEYQRTTKSRYQHLFISGLVCFRSGDFQKSRQLFEQYAAECPFDPVARLYIERHNTLEADPLRRKEWTGIYETWTT